MNGIQKQHGERTFTECRNSSKSAVKHSFAAMELVDEIHSDDENGTADDVIQSDDENGTANDVIQSDDESGTADDVIFVCTSTASASADESDEIRQKQQQMNESQHSFKSTVKHSFAAMELVDEIHSDDENGTADVIQSDDESGTADDVIQSDDESGTADDVIQSDDENGTADDVIFVCTSTASASADESDEICHLPLTNRVLPPFPSLDANLLAEFSDIDVANVTSPAEELAQKFARQNLRSIDRAKAILQLFDSGPISAADPCEQEELKPSPECQPFCSVPFQSIEEDEEIEYIGTVKKSSGN